LPNSRDEILAALQDQHGLTVEQAQSELQQREAEAERIVRATASDDRAARRRAREHLFSPELLYVAPAPPSPPGRRALRSETASPPPTARTPLFGPAPVARPARAAPFESGAPRPRARSVAATGGGPSIFARYWAWTTGGSKLNLAIGTGGPLLVALIIFVALSGNKKDEAAATSGSNVSIAPSGARATGSSQSLTQQAGAPRPVATQKAFGGGSAFSFDNGTKEVGADIPPGTYRTRTGASGCYWARLSGLGGSVAETIANDTANGPAIVTIAAGDKAFQSKQCGTWTKDLSAITNNMDMPFKEGTYLVGVDISPGTWKAETPSTCYWARLQAFEGKASDIVASNTGVGNVTIAGTDKGFKTARCGTWTKQSS
jgi:hypothetical protein